MKVVLKLLIVKYTLNVLALSFHKYKLLILIAGPKDDQRIWETIPDYNPQTPSSPNYPTHPPYYPRPPPESPQHPRRPPQTPRQPPTSDPVTPEYPERPTKKPHRKAGKPDTCDTSYDAISVIRREVFIFKGRVRASY